MKYQLGPMFVLRSYIGQRLRKLGKSTKEEKQLGWVDIIDSYLRITESRNSPVLFRQWAAISIVAGALERRVWVKIMKDPLYPNLFILLCATPGIGKGQAINPATALLRRTKHIRLAPDSTNSATMLDAFAEGKQAKVLSKIEMVEYSSLFVSCEEFGVFVPGYDQEFMQRICRIFDNPPDLSVRRKYLGKDAIAVTNPMLNILGGTTPGYLSSLLPEEAWHVGFAARFIMVYTAKGPHKELFQEYDEREDPLEGKIVGQLSELSKAYGLVAWETDAAREMARWHRAKEDAPEHSRLIHYVQRRTQFLAKLCMVAAFSRSGEAIITINDLDRAKSWLLEAEQRMPDLFRDMAGKSDSAVMSDLHIYIQRYNVIKKKGMPSSFIWKFLGEKVPSEKIERIIDTMTKSDMIKVGADLGYIARPRYDRFGVE